MAKLKNHLIDLLFSCQKDIPQGPHPEIENVKYVYSTTPTNSPLRWLFVSWFTWPVNRTMARIEISSDTLSTVPEFTIDLACNAMYKLHDMGGKNPFEMSALSRKLIYHEDVPGDQDYSDNDNNIAPNSEEAHESDMEESSFSY